MARDSGGLKPYELLADLAAAELELVRGGEWETVHRLQAERDTLVSRLPDSAPPEALEPLERAARLQRETSAAIAGALEVARQEIGRIDRGRGLVEAYTPTITHVASVDYSG